MYDIYARSDDVNFEQERPRPENKSYWIYEFLKCIIRFTKGRTYNKKHKLSWKLRVGNWKFKMSNLEICMRKINGDMWYFNEHCFHGKL